MSMMNWNFELQAQGQRKGRRTYRAPSPPINRKYRRPLDGELLRAGIGALLAAAVIAFYVLVMAPDIWR